MAEIINLRQARKAQARDQARAAGDENAARFGRTKAQKLKEAREADKARAALDGHKLDQDGRDPE